MPTMQNRRHFLTSLSLATATGLAGLSRSVARAEPPPETTRLRLAKIPGICVAPQYVVEEFLRVEGFTEVSYVVTGAAAASASAVAEGAIDFSLNFVAPSIVAIDQGQRLIMLGGVHPGCYELFVKPGINSFLTSMAAYVGLDPLHDINWVMDPKIKPKDRFLRGDIDAFLGFPPEPQELRAKRVGRVLVNSALDQPWSQYFCCLLTGNSDFVAEHPVATKRVLRAILKAADLCVSDPAMVARRLVDGQFTSNYDFAFEALTEVPYRKWRDYDAEDSVRFYALRLHEAGTITSIPQDIIAKGTDWRFVDELKREMKS
jgi:NitT/TauT family transport system substrate-binding protein